MGSTQKFETETGMDLRDLLDDIGFLGRKKPQRGTARHLQALQSLAQVFAENPNAVLQKLVNIAVEFCGADSAGISLEEPDETGAPTFRWVAIAGSFAQYLNGRTPRSPTSPSSPFAINTTSARSGISRVRRPQPPWPTVLRIRSTTRCNASPTAST